MRGFKKKPQKKVTFTQGDESINYTLHTLPLLFMPMVREMIPTSENMSPTESHHIVERWTACMVAEALRPTEDIPAHPGATASPEEWSVYTDTLSATYQGAGLKTSMVNVLALAVDELEKNTLVDVLDTEGKD
jgi:hypothetical protein